MSKPIRFRSPTDETLYVANTTGHAARIGTAWRELPPQLHADAIAAGAITDNMDDATAATQRAKVVPETPTAPDNSGELIRKGITEMLEGGDTEDFTKAGLPALGRLSARVGFGVDRQQMLAVWHAMEAESEAAGEPVDATA